MRLGMGVPKTLAERRESRIPMEVRVQISGHLAQPGTETTFTENVSAGGARVWSTRRWKTGDRLTITTLTGSFKSIARVAYCQLVPEAGFAVGVEFLESRDGWVVSNMSAA
jgi:PilZ domain